MRHGTHELIGVSVAVLVARAAHADTVETGGLALASFYGSLLPDVDRLGSRIHRRTRLERRHPTMAMAGALARMPAVVFALLARHRGLSHSALAALGGGLLLAALFAPLGLTAASVAGGGLFLGYVSHLLADACTPSGIRPWAPISQRKLWLLPPRLRVPTGTLRETALAMAIGVVLATMLLVR